MAGFRAVLALAETIRASARCLIQDEGRDSRIWFFPQAVSPNPMFSMQNVLSEEHPPPKILE